MGRSLNLTKTIMATILLIVSPSIAFGSSQKPNIVYILADDLGYGDVQCLNPDRGKIPTPHMDKLAADGMIFTDAHTSSSVCTPSRYGLLTGRYNWRTGLQQGVLWGYSAPLIAPDRLTVPGFLKQHGYNTAIVGKWHLGMIMPTTNGVLPVGRKPKTLNILWDGKIQEGPVDRGFDYFYGISASLDMAPYIYIENDRFDGTIAKGDKSTTAPGFTRESVLPEIGKKSVEYIRKQDKSQPFFLYVPFTSPHTPIVPTAEWQGKSGINSYADFVMQTDHVVGQIVAAIDEAGLGENTIVIVTSDNGCSKAARISTMEAKGHYPSAHLRGSKADLWDGGHRVPFIIRWPAGVKAGSQSGATICLTDLMATCADVVGAKLPDTAGEDSVSFLPALSGKPVPSTRSGVVHHSISGHFGYRQGKWKLLLAWGSGGWTAPTERGVPAGSPMAQLFDMDADPGETTNLFAAQPELAKRLLDQLTSDIQRGRSTDGAAAKNDSDEINLWKSGQTVSPARAAAKKPAKKKAVKKPQPTAGREKMTIEPDRELVYKTVDKTQLKLHVFEPKGLQPTDKRPAVVFFFGGGWSAGTPKQFYQQAQILADRGMVAFSAEYRVRSRDKTTPFECVKDGKSAIRWVRSHAADLGVDPNRIVASGGSAGGHVAACTGVIRDCEEEGQDLSVSSLPNAMILFNPVLDTTEKGYGAKRFKPEQQTDLSPCHQVSAGVAPTLLLHGTKDTTVPFENAERFAQRMKEAGNECVLVPFADRGHGFFNGTFFRPKSDGTDFDQCMEASIEFLTNHGNLDTSGGK